jgi:O-antigen ligase
MGPFNWLKANINPPPFVWPVIGVVGALLLGTAGVPVIAASPRIGLLLAMLVGLAAIAFVWTVRWRMSLYGVLVSFIFVILLTTYVPFSVRLFSLNLRPHQLLLPIALLWLLAVGAFDRASPTRVWLLAAGGLLWGATLFWTVVHLSELRSATQALGRVMLLGINLLTALVTYLLVVRTGAWRRAVAAFQNSVVGLNAFLLTLATLATLGVAQVRGWLGTDEEPILVGGQVVAGETLRFAGGVVNGVLAALALVLILVQGQSASRRARWGLLAGALICAAGMVVGFSRQSVVSLLGALLVLGFYLLRRGQIKLLLRLAVAGLLAGSLVLVGVSQWSVTRPFYQAFAARVLLLLNPTSYSTGTVNERLVMWSAMMRDVVANPLVGAGQDGYLVYYPVLGGGGSHNYPIEILHSAGLGGFIPYLYLHVVVGVEAWRAVRRKGLSERDRWLMLGLLAAYAAMVLSSLTNLIFSNSSYWFVLGLVAGSARVVGRDGSKPALET